MKEINYLFNPESTALDWLWSAMLIYIVLGLLSTSIIVGILFAIHVLVIGTISMYHMWLFFKSMGAWMEQMQKERS